MPVAARPDQRKGEIGLPRQPSEAGAVGKGGAHPHLVLPGHVQQIVAPPVADEVLGGDEAGIVCQRELIGLVDPQLVKVAVTTDGYATKTSTLTASRSYPNLSEADVSLIPKSIEDKGKTLTLGDVKWRMSTPTSSFRVMSSR